MRRRIRAVAAACAAVVAMLGVPGVAQADYPGFSTSWNKTKAHVDGTNLQYHGYYGSHSRSFEWETYKYGGVCTVRIVFIGHSYEIWDNVHGWYC